MKHVVICTASTALIVGFALRPGLDSWALMWGALVVGHGLLAAYSGAVLHNLGLLKDLLVFRRGDPTMGIITGLGMLAAGWLSRGAMIPAGSAEHAWLFNIYIRIGDVEGSTGATIMLLAIVLMEELTWRGLVLQQLTTRFGLRFAFPLSAGLYALAMAPTVFTLADATAGPNPLLLLAALGCGLVWAYLRVSSGRLWPAVFSHCIFSYFGAAWLIGPPNIQSGFGILP